MHIPPYHKKATWQRFFVGVMVGGILAYCSLLYMYGKMYEDLIIRNHEMQNEISQLRTQNESLLEDNDELNEKSAKQVSVESISFTVENTDELRMDRLIAGKLEELVQEELKHIIGKDLAIIAESDSLIAAALENKAFTVEEFDYSFSITKLIISNHIKITAEAKRST
ncbi:sporulation membrane protein YtrI [Virgibacillus pantothenticus]|uniref:sporulation membrane protein YtrI n=1 Tax=Virgibacillus pantothenticus TaxID=1473 RepID=UPI0009867C03|nr:sporulation membrane protein YtrI [Virgibacillus pantothenticus]